MMTVEPCRCSPVGILPVQCGEVGIVQELSGLAVEVDGALVVGGGGATWGVWQVVGEVGETTQCH